MHLKDHRWYGFWTMGSIPHAHDLGALRFADLCKPAADWPHGDEAAEDPRRQERPSFRQVAPWLPGQMDKTLLADPQLAATPLFGTLKPQSVAGDMLPEMRAILGGNKPDTCKVYELSSKTIALLNRGRIYRPTVGEDDRVTYALGFKLSRAAHYRLFGDASSPNPWQVLSKRNWQIVQERQRLDEVRVQNHENLPRPSTVIPLQIHRLVVWHFAEGRLIAVPEIGIADDGDEGHAYPFDLAWELADGLSRLGELVWLGYGAEQSGVAYAEGQDLVPMWIETGELSLGKILSRLLLGEYAVYQRDRRTFGYSYARLKDTNTKGQQSELRLAAVRAALSLTSDYDVADPVPFAGIAQPFQNMVHAAGLEGACTLVADHSDGRNLSFLDDFRTNRIEQEYRLLLVLAIYQRYEGLRLLRKISKGVEGEKRDIHQRLAELDALYNQVANLQARYRDHQLSAVGTQLLFNRLVRTQLGLDEIEVQLNQDMRLVFEREQAAAAAENAREDAKMMRAQGKMQAWAKWFGALSAGFLAFVTTLQIGTLTDQLPWLPRDEWLILLAVGVALFAAFAAYVAGHGLTKRAPDVS